MNTSGIDALPGDRVTASPTTKTFVMVADRGGHLATALQLLEQLQLEPVAILVSGGPEVAALARVRRTVELPHLFAWFGTRRVLNPIATLHHILLTLVWAVRIRPDVVLSFGAYSSPCFCYWAWVFGSRIVHIECLNAVTVLSRSARLVRPICSEVFVQWEELAEWEGGKVRYAGWVL